jgi:hypothetical protein
MRRIHIAFLILFVPALAFSSPFANPIVFVKQKKVNHSGGAIQDVTGNFLGAHPSMDQPVGGGLFVLNPKGDVHAIVSGSNIAVRDPEVSQDGQKVIFSMKEGGKGKWQIWEFDFKTNLLIKFSKDPNVNDFDPAFLPYDWVVFVSDRLDLADTYQNFPSAQMYLVRTNGTDMQLLNANPGGHLNPVPMFYAPAGFGVILFSEFDSRDMRKNVWQKPDSLAVNRLLPWFVYRDGSSFDHPLFGAHTIPDFQGGYVSVRELRKTKYLIGIQANLKNTFGAGSIVKMKFTTNADRQMPVYLTPNVLDLKEENHYGRWRDSYPMSDGTILASYAEGAVYQTKKVLSPSEIPNFKIVRLSADGKKQETVYEDSDFWCWQPVELTAGYSAPFSIGVPRSTKVTYAMINSLDVYHRGVNFKKVINGDHQPVPERGSILFVRIFEMAKTHNANPEFTRYRSGRFVELGKAPVRGDGSFAAIVPADTPLIWELVDEKNRVVVRERFGTILKSGEVRVCVGCHAPHDGSTGNTSNDALFSVTNLAGVDPDVDNNGILDIFENLGIPGYEH